MLSVIKDGFVFELLKVSREIVMKYVFFWYFVILFFIVVVKSE